VLQPGSTNRSMPPVPDQAAPKRTVLVVDDEKVVRNLVARILTDAGYQVLTAANGFEALDALVQADPVDLLLTDLTMPGMSGEQLARCAGQLTPAPRFLFVSGFFTSHTDSRLPGPLLSKPFSRADLLGLVAQLITSAIP
jgi:two-component system cell cycle sensor histidine kinase/response regulator CckA